MGLKTGGRVPNRDARSRLPGCVDKIIDTKNPDCNKDLKNEFAGIVLLDQAEIGLKQILAGQRISLTELMKSLSD